MKPFQLLGWCLVLTGLTVASHAAEYSIVSLSGELAVVVCDDNGLNYCVETFVREVVTPSRLGLIFKDGTVFGPSVVITKNEASRNEGQWENRFGQLRFVSYNWRQLSLILEQKGESNRVFGLIVRVFDDGVAFRYDLPEKSGLGDFVLIDELTKFVIRGTDYQDHNELRIALNKYVKMSQ